MFKNRFIIILAVVALLLVAAVAGWKTLSAKASVDRSFHIPQTSNYQPVDRSFHTPQSSNYQPADRSFHTPQSSNYAPVDRSFHTPQTSDYTAANSSIGVDLSQISKFTAANCGNAYQSSHYYEYGPLGCATGLASPKSLVQPLGGALVQDSSR